MGEMVEVLTNLLLAVGGCPAGPVLALEHPGFA